MRQLEAVTARAWAAERAANETLELQRKIDRTPLPKDRRPARWVRVRVRLDCSGFQYRAQDGSLAQVHAGETALIDDLTLESRERLGDVERI